ncbi:hypothetical protein M5W68_12165 [Paenibacillus larvae]|uniref:hypothetical protein n=1 Tax=Paenibacillus larvae TaxID=1464 RepID=UPI00227F3BA2|nr:hypothetical protein [Paenibacillus larvae]MCY9510590.1 hypothetical protein [Paenibacillus larvae]MCY9525851.1 hypothetical protein [Paenibacillus larvae]
MNLLQASKVEKETGKYMEALALVEKDGKYFNLLDQMVEADETVVFDPLPKGIYTPIWDFKEKVWKEGLSKEEIEEIQNRPDPPTPEQRIRGLEEALSKQKEDMDKAIMELTFALGGAKKDV